MSTRRKYDENYEKPSKHKQWRERSETPVATREMTNEEIKEFHAALVRSYKCDEGDIKYSFRKIFDKHDEDRDDCILLNYTIQCVSGGKPVTRTIFSIKLPLPAEIRQQADDIRKQNARSRRPNAKPLAICAVEEVPDLIAPITTNVVRKKPVRPIKK